MSAAYTPANSADRTHVRTIISSLLAGIAATVVIGAMGAFVVNGGLDATPASASTPTEAFFASMARPEPIDVGAVQAQLDAVDKDIARAEGATASAMSRLDALSGR